MFLLSTKVMFSKFICIFGGGGINSLSLRIIHPYILDFTSRINSSKTGCKLPRIQGTHFSGA